MKSGVARLARRITRAEIQLDARGDDRNFPIPAHSGMAGLRTAIQQAEAAHGEAKWEPPVGEAPWACRALARGHSE
jgi:hypothetical protein